MKFNKLVYDDSLVLVAKPVTVTSLACSLGVLMDPCMCACAFVSYI